jgi:hypothetical protein
MQCFKGMNHLLFPGQTKRQLCGQMRIGRIHQPWREKPSTAAARMPLADIEAAPGAAGAKSFDEGRDGGTRFPVHESE